MTLLRPVVHCLSCGAPVIGRLDKVFCTVSCKSMYHLRRKAQRIPVSYPIDSILHRNWVVLMEAHELAGTNKFFVSAAQLQKEGFRPEYHTTTSSNKDSKSYYYVYDFGWMQFSEKELMIIKLNKPR